MNKLKTCISLLAVLFVYCSYHFVPEESRQPLSETIGIVYRSDYTPAANICIRFIDTGAVASPSQAVFVDSVYTDALGQYAVTALQAGVYNIFGESGGEYFYHHNVLINHDTTRHDTLIDTLGQPGSVSGIVKHQYHAGSGFITMLMPGAGRYSVPDDTSGAFYVSYLARGTYRIRFHTTLQNYATKDTTITIRAGVNDTLSDTVYLACDGIPQITGFAGTYDTLSHRVIVSWNPLPVSLITGYTVYRAEAGTVFDKFADVPAAYAFLTDSSVLMWKTYHYRVVGYSQEESGPPSDAVTVQVAYLPQGWYRGQLHCHTTHSDGWLPVEDAMQKYKDARYDFVAVSDHNIVTPTEQFITGDFLTIPNDELTFELNHVNAINASGPFNGVILSPSVLVDVVNAAESIDAVPQINHPQYSGHTVADIMSTSAMLLEIVNFRHDDPNYTVALWDSVLSKGRLIYGTAGDDAHNYAVEFNRAWVIVRAPALTVQSIVTALESGDFYASYGPVIREISCTGRTMSVKSIDGETIAFYGSNHTLLSTVNGDSASYTLPPDSLYVRAEITDAIGRRAFVQPYFP